jgi:excisionase family DNA binding protein
MKDSEYLLVNETAERLQVAPNTVRAWAAAGKLREYRHPVNNYRLFRKADVEKLKLAIGRPKLSAAGRQP